MLHPLRIVLICVATTLSTMACAASEAAPADPVSRGQYLATAGDCAGCHTAPGGQPYAGGLMMPTPFGQISVPNITPDKVTGIGAWSDDEFYRAMHEGIGKNGEYLYPVFPFPWFTKVTRDDAVAIKAYLFSLQPQSAPRQPVKLNFPFNLRQTLLPWRTLFFRAAEFKPDPAASADVNRGAYLVEGLGHCGECHNHRNVLGASDWSGKLQGGEIEGWYAPNLTADGHEGVGSWSADDLAKFLKTGASPHGVVLGPMTDVVSGSLSKLTDPDLQAMAAYLKTTTAKATYKPKEYSAYSDEKLTEPGAQAYLSHCAFCHGGDGKGLEGAVPALAGNGVVKAQGGQNLIRVVLGGVLAANGRGPMPAVGAGMTDQQIADAINYIRQSWGNTAPPDVQAGAVAKARADTHTLLAANPEGGCPTPEPGPLGDAIRTATTGSDLQHLNLSRTIEAVGPMTARVKQSVADAKREDIVNAFVAAYCPVVEAQIGEPARRALALGNFAVLVYGELLRSEAK